VALTAQIKHPQIKKKRFTETAEILPNPRFSHEKTQINQGAKNPDFKLYKYIAIEESPLFWGNPGRTMIFKWLAKN